MPIKDFTGQKINLLTVIGPTANRKYGLVLWECRCECGNTVERICQRLESAYSCGCTKRPRKPYRPRQTAFPDYGRLTSNGLQIDRTNNNGDYGPSNCRWVTNAENSKNRRDTTIDQSTAVVIKGLLVDGFGSTEIAKWCNVPRTVVHNILYYNTWFAAD